MASFGKRSEKIVNHMQAALIVVPTVFTALGIVFTGLRVYARRLKGAKILTDDYLCIAACILSLPLLGGNIAMVVAAGGANGRPMEEQDMNEMLLWFKLLIATYVLWLVAIGLVQLAILFLYRRLFFIVHWFRMACYILMGLVAAWFIAGLISDFTICTPVQLLWDPTVPGTCKNSKAMCTSVGVVHAVLDFSILMMPMPLIWNLKTTTMNKIFLSIMLLCGVFATISAVLRLQCLFKLSSYGEMDLLNYMWLPLIYHFVETPVAIICCCIPALPPLADKFRGMPFFSYARSLFSRKSQSKLVQSNELSYQSGKPSEIDSRNFKKLGSESVSQRRANSDEVPFGHDERSVL